LQMLPLATGPVNAVSSSRRCVTGTRLGESNGRDQAASFAGNGSKERMAKSGSAP